jgi:molecular chaperone DnaJ
VTVLDVPAPIAALGATLSAPSLEGDVDVEVAAGTQPGAVVTVGGKGMPRLRRPGRHGDLRVVVNVVVPRKLTKDQRRLAQELADSMTEDNLRTDESFIGKLKRLLG